MPLGDPILVKKVQTVCTGCQGDTLLVTDLYSGYAEVQPNGLWTGGESNEILKGSSGDMEINCPSRNDRTGNFCPEGSIKVSAVDLDATAWEAADPTYTRHMKPLVRA